MPAGSAETRGLGLVAAEAVGAVAARATRLARRARICDVRVIVCSFGRG
jgi:cell division GTPase FtsZ